MSAEHTPGPWQSDLQYRRVILGGDGSDVALVKCNANANLIAAAPEMLNALLDLRDAFYVKGSKNALIDAFNRSRDVIAKAEGKEGA